MKEILKFEEIYLRFNNSINMKTFGKSLKNIHFHLH